MTEVNFDSLNLPIPDIIKTYSDEKKREIFETKCESEYWEW